MIRAEVKFLTLTILVSLVVGCAGQRDMERMLEQIQNSYVVGLAPIFDAKHEKIVQAIAHKRVEYIVQNIDYSGSNEGLNEQVALEYVSNIIQELTSISTEYSEYRSPAPSKSELDELGYTYFMSAENSHCTIHFEVNYAEPESESEEPLLFNIHIVSRSRDCPSATDA